MYLQRKYVDLIRQVTSKWVNMDPPIPIEVGAYGHIERDTGALRVEGNIYDRDFQAALDALDIPIRMSDFPPEEGCIEEDAIIASSGATRVSFDLGPQAGLAGLVNVGIQGSWEFQHGKRHALLIMRAPRLRYLPSGVIVDALYRASSKLRGRWLVTSVHVCPAFSMYLSSKSGEKVSLALVGQAPPLAAVPGVSVGGEVGLSWWCDAQAEFIRRAADRLGRYCFTPLYTMKRRAGIVERLFRQGKEETEEEEDDLWDESTPPWDPLDEDGEEDALDVDEEDNEDF